MLQPVKLSRLLTSLLGGALLSMAALSMAALQPGMVQLAHAEEADAPKPANEITFSGYQRFADGSARFFVRMTSKPDLEEAIEGKLLKLTLQESYVGLRNNKNPLDLRHFDSALLRAQLVSKGRNVDLVMRFRRPVKELKIKHRFAKRNDGSYSLQIDIPSLRK